MGDSSDDQLERRVASLEALVETLLAEVREAKAAVAGSASRVKPAAPRAPSTPRNPAPPHWTSDPVAPKEPAASTSRAIPSFSIGGTSEQWLGRAGIGFIALAVLFLLKLSFDRGWITPAFRLIGGGSLGVALLVIGLRLEENRRGLAQLLLGGSAAIIYMVGFAGFQLYDLLIFPVAVGIMSANTIVAMAGAERLKSQVLAVIAAIGGLSTPFLLATDTANINGLAGYFALVIVGVGGLYFKNGWKGLLVTLTTGGAATLGVILARGGTEHALAGAAASGAYWVMVGLLPALRAHLRNESPPTHAAAPYQRLGAEVVTRFGLIVSTFVATLVTVGLLEGDSPGMAVGFGAAAAIMAGLSWWARASESSREPLADVALLAVMGAVLFEPGGAEGVFLAAALTPLASWIVRSSDYRSVRITGDLIAIWMGVSFLIMSADPELSGEGLGMGAIWRLGVVIAFVLAGRLRAGTGRLAYWLAAYFGLMVWILAELNGTQWGPQLVTLGWSIMGAAVLISSVNRQSGPLQGLGLGTLAVVGGKLLLVDLVELDAAWRVLVFLGFGVALLGLAWLLNRPRPERSPEG